MSKTRGKKNKRMAIVGKSKNSWFQLAQDTRDKYKSALLVRDGYKCNICNDPFTATDLTVDHILAISRGGNVTEIGNMQLLCKTCHNEKTKGERKLYEF